MREPNVLRHSTDDIIYDLCRGASLIQNFGIHGECSAASMTETTLSNLQNMVPCLPRTWCVVVAIPMLVSAKFELNRPGDGRSDGVVPKCEWVSTWGEI
jgi:hypothetical protein